MEQHDQTLMRNRCSETVAYHEPQLGIAGSQPHSLRCATRRRFLQDGVNRVTFNARQGLLFTGVRRLGGRLALMFARQPVSRHPSAVSHRSARSDFLSCCTDTTRCEPTPQPQIDAAHGNVHSYRSALEFSVYQTLLGKALAGLNLSLGTVPIRICPPSLHPVIWHNCISPRRG